MAILGVPSTSIVDSTSVGRSLITASDAAAARVIMELAAVDDVTFNSVSAVDGSFSGNLNTEVGGEIRSYDLGTDGDADTTFGVMKFVGNYLYLGTDSTGVGPDKDFLLLRGGSAKMILSTSTTTTYNSLSPVSSGTLTCGKSANRWSDVFAVDGDFSGTVTAASVIGTGNLLLQNLTNTSSISLAGSGAVTITAFSAIYQQFTTLGVGYRKACYPIFNGSLDLGLETLRWGKTWSVDGSFTGTLDVEVGGSQRVYNLGTDGDADTEYLETSWDTNVATIAAKSTGTGVDRGLTLESAGTTKLIGTYARIYADNNLSINCFGTTTQFGSSLQPSSDNTRYCGVEGKRWSSVASVDGNFSGDVIMAANVDFTGLPTSDPVVAGRLWNDSGTMKISAG